MDLGIKGKVVFVTGASKGIGYACAEAFAREGAKVALVSRSAANLEAALAKFPAVSHAPRTYVADLVRAEDAERMAADAERELGPVDIPVHLPGGAANAALMLASDLASYVTGAIVPMDGGASAVI